MPFTLDRDDFWIPRDGVSLVRILPALAVEEDFYLEVATHYEVTEECRALICQKMYKTSCLVCRYAAQLRSVRDRDSQARAARMAQRMRTMMNVHPLGTREVKVWSISESTLGKILSIIVDEGVSQLTHPALGRDLRVIRSGEGEDTRYQVQARPRATPVKLHAWEAKLYNLRKEFRPPTNAEVWEILGTRMERPSQRKV